MFCQYHNKMFIKYKSIFISLYSSVHSLLLSAMTSGHYYYKTIPCIKLYTNAFNQKKKINHTEVSLQDTALQLSK